MSESHRRAPRADVVTYRITLDLDDAEPRIWRELELRSDLLLDQLHHVVQTAMGWTDSHLHAFAVGDSWHDRGLERFAMEGGEDEGFLDAGPEVPETLVRLDELLQEVGDVLLYTYDFGDGWDHTLRLGAVLPRPDGAPAARCMAGEGACPPEDCGGIYGYQEILLGAADPTLLDPDQRTELLERMQWYFPGVAPSELATAARSFDPSTVNAALERGPLPPLPPPLAELLGRAHGPGRDVLEQQLERAGLDRPVLIDAADAQRMVEPFAWFVRHVGAGLPLTAAGYLRPADVEAVVAALAISREWIGTLNRESLTPPVLDFRQAAQKLGLVRVSKGWLRATRLGAELADDPVRLWWHVAARLPVGGRSHEHDAALVTLLAAASLADPADQATVMASLGWEFDDGSPLDPAEVRRAAGVTRDVLERMQAFDRAGRFRWADTANRDGVMLARAALRTWA